jgi:hypothetical protein
MKTILPLLLLLAACASEDVCAPGIQEACACPDGVPGAQACNAEGSGFELCICDDGPLGAGNAGGGSAGVGGTDEATPGQPPPADTGAPAGDGSAPRSFAVTHLYVGQYAFGSSTESTDAWKGFGYDIDHQNTGSSFSGHCTPVGGASPSSVFPDGNDGNDNAFGKVLLPILKTATATSSDLEALLNEPIEGGDYTLVFDLLGLGAGSSYTSVSSSFFEAREKTGSTWLMGPESSSGGEPTLQFPEAYVVDDVWVSGRSDGVLPMDLLFGSLRLRIHRPLITAQLSPDHTTVSGGLISGVLVTAELVDDMRNLLAAFQPAFCGGSAIEGVLNQVRQASDIKMDGSQGSGACSGISIGLGFDGEMVTIGGLASPKEPLEDPCAFDD